MKIILLDIDGVLADFVGHALKLLHKEEVIVDRWDFYDQLEMTAKEFWNAIDKAGHNFWANIPKLPWADHIIEQLQLNIHDTEHKIILCTSPTNSPYCVSGKIEWIHKNYPQFKDYFIITPCKTLLGGRDNIVIDDNEMNCESFNSMGSHTVLFPQLWNSNKDLINNRIQFFHKRMDCIAKLLWHRMISF